MKTDEVLKVVESRGLKVILGTDGRLRLRGVRDRITPTLLRVLKWHREEILRRFKSDVAERGTDRPRGQA